ncbi:EAL domain-containing protein [Sulfurimonas paralvinellae]|uniref:EAL domain-containing protein n=1 Tax=Sulfurimonas paralvinellae TaxID=317658 RepID=UPI001D0505D9|nr:EAL domain-containing protein [Sulfurimonas paralvinellae]
MNKIDLHALIKRTKPLHLLVVEDDEAMRKVTVTFLNTFFDNIHCAGDGVEALQVLGEEPIDMILTDINMPNMNGLEFIAKLREMNCDLPIMILSAHAEPSYFLQSIKYSVDGYLLKPFDIEQFFPLLLKIVKCLEDKKELLEYHNQLETMVAQKTKELEYRCLHEYYTDLPNAIMLHQDLEKWKCGYMLLLDMSHFSVINKEYGKAFANHVIIRTARILEKHIHKNAKLYKTESDRFAILLKESPLKEVYLYCDQIISFFDNHNIGIDDTELNITFNIGVDKIRADASDTLINCEYALDKSKELGSRHYEVFSARTTAFKDEKEAVKWLRLTRELIMEEKIEPYYQPIKDLKSGKVVKYEALARGIYKDEIVAPHFFVQQAEKLGLSTALTRLMINKSFAFFQDKTEEFSINLTERDLLEGYLIRFLTEKMKQYSIEPSRITFEILENITVTKNSKRITQKLNRLREIGFQVAIDDFGIENSNFSRLLEINIDFIKIDGIFIRDLKENEKNRMITRAIVNLAKTLGIKTVAEYVEDAEIYTLIKECGIDYAQGYFIGKPAPKLLDT